MNQLNRDTSHPQCLPVHVQSKGASDEVPLKTVLRSRPPPAFSASASRGGGGIYVAWKQGLPRGDPNGIKDDAFCELLSTVPEGRDGGTSVLPCTAVRGDAA